MRIFFRDFFRNLARVFMGRNVFAHIAAIMVTFVAVNTGVDWWYYLSTRNPALLSFMFPAAVIGGLLPIIVPLTMYAIGAVTKRAETLRTAGALGQAAILGFVVSAAYKAFTGRAHPMMSAGVGPDITRVFQFGFLRGGVFWGWPSSHTTVAFAMSTALAALFPKKKALGIAAIMYALYIGIGVSMTIHWFSDFLAGALIGTVIGLTVGRSYRALKTI